VLRSHLRQRGRWTDTSRPPQRDDSKRSPSTDALGNDRLHLAKEDILFAAFGGWDVAGAKAFGYPAFWVNRFNQPLGESGIRPDLSQSGRSGQFRAEQDDCALIFGTPTGSRSCRICTGVIAVEYS
jgi:hypothetical protein